VQVGVYVRPVTSVQLFNITPLYDEFMTNGYYRYISGTYTTVREAITAKNEIVVRGVSDAFVVIYYNGRKISMVQAKEIEAGNTATINYVNNIVPIQPNNTKINQATTNTNKSLKPIVKSDTASMQNKTNINSITTNKTTSNTNKTTVPIVKSDTADKQNKTNVNSITTNKTTSSTNKTMVPVVKSDTFAKQNLNNVTDINNTKTKADSINASNDTTSTIQNYYIIANSYPSEQDAMDAVRVLNLKGFNDAGVVSENNEGNYLVYYKAFNSSTEALSVLSVIKRLVNPSAWLYEKK